MTDEAGFDTDTVLDEVRSLRERLERAEATITTLTSSLAASERSRGRDHPSPPAPEVASEVTSEIASLPTDRRHLLKRAGLAAGAAAAAGIAATVAGSTPAAAADGDPVILGSTNNYADHRTQAWNLSTADENLFEFADTITAASTDDESALVGFATRVRTGVAGVSTASNGIGVAGKATEPYGIGVTGSGSSYGVVAASTGSQTSGSAFLATQSFAGMAFSFCTFPIVFTGAVGSTSGPPQGGISAPMGATFVDGIGVLYFCVAAGDPGTWIRITGPDTAGAFTTITPTRVYDSRLAGGQLIGGQNRVVSVANGIDLGTGAVNAPDLVPVGATAIAYNLTVTDTQGSGYLQVAPGDTTGITSSSINWSTAGQTIANGLVVKVDGSRQVNATVGAGATQFIIDVLGYYR